MFILLIALPLLLATVRYFFLYLKGNRTTTQVVQFTRWISLFYIIPVWILFIVVDYPGSCSDTGLCNFTQKETYQGHIIESTFWYSWYIALMVFTSSFIITNSRLIKYKNVATTFLVIVCIFEIVSLIGYTKAVFFIPNDLPEKAPNVFILPKEI